MFKRTYLSYMGVISTGGRQCATPIFETIVDSFPRYIYIKPISDKSEEPFVIQYFVDWVERESEGCWFVLSTSYGRSNRIFQYGK